MLREVRADGFRSLDGFSMAVRPGLNVLVGPNGGGKTNILALFAFVSVLASEELPDAISSSGGVSKVFKKLGEGSFQKNLKVGVTGSFDIERSPFYVMPKYRTALTDAQVSSIDFMWDCEIDASNGYDQAFFKRQELRVRVNLATDGSVQRKPYDFSLTVETLSGGVSFTEELLDDDRAALIHQSEPNEAGDYFSPDQTMLSKVSIVPLFFIFGDAYIFRWLAFGLSGGTTFNFDPVACKKPNDSARAPNLERDGSGLAAAIYAIQKADYAGYNMFRYPLDGHVYAKGTYKNLETYFRLINPSIEGVEAVNDPITNSITVNISVNSGEDHTVDFPLEFASDGTVKWLAFNVALLSQRSGFSIEEPENFLHPDIQRHAVELVRAEIGDERDAFVMMTTHSESLLNASRPDEIIVVSMEDGVTSSKRLRDPHLISEEIRETGFGLGYYYIAGSFDD